MNGVYKMEGVTPDGDCVATMVLSNTCPVCKAPCTAPMMALSAPYYCIVHKQCLPLFPFDGTYPHDAAISVLISRR